MQLIQLFTLTAGAALALALGPGLAAPPAKDAPRQTFTGSLHDADCREANSGDRCDVSEASKSFLLRTADGKTYRVDGDGNQKVRTALNAKRANGGETMASLVGSMAEGVIHVESVTIH
ncbi:MAG: hypothetical protein U0Q16_38970 [Bryobacteraceae bacterium]